MERFEASALTHMLVVADVERSRDWYMNVLDAELFGEYGGTSVQLSLTRRTAYAASSPTVQGTRVLRVKDATPTHMS